MEKEITGQPMQRDESKDKQMVFFQHLIVALKLAFVFLPQVFAVSEELVSQVLSRLTDMLVDEFCKLISGVKTFTSAGAVTVS